MIRVLGIHLGRWESLHHVAKSTPCIDRSGFSTAEISGSVQGPTGNQAHRHATRRANTALTPYRSQSLVLPIPGRALCVPLLLQLTLVLHSNQYAISFASGLTGIINLTAALPNLDNNISITGPGASSLTVNRLSTDADFPIFAVGNTDIVSVSGMTISGGYFFCGGIYNLGTLTVTNDTFANNVANRGGGGIGNFGTLAVIGSTFINNSAPGSASGGGGIYNNGATAMVSGSTFIGNSALYGYGGSFDGMAAYGGGIFNSGSISVSNSTFTDNSSDDGGGIFNDETLTLTNCTYHRQHQPGKWWCRRWHIFNLSYSSYPIKGSLTLNNTIAAGNTASSGGNDVDGTIQPTSSYDTYR